VTARGVRVRDRIARSRQAMIALAVALAVCGYGDSPHASAQTAQRKVLVLLDTGRDSQMAILVDRLLPQLLNAGSDVDYYSEYFDTGRFLNDGYDVTVRDFLAEKYAAQRFDLILAVQDFGLQFLIQHRARLFPGVPVVFASSSPVAATIPNATGLIAETDYGRTLDLALSLQPDLRQVFVITGTSDSDRAIEGEAREQFRRFESRLSFTYLAGLSIGALERRLAELPADAVAYYLLLYQDGDGRNFHPLYVVNRLAMIANRPTYAWVDSTLGLGVLGGSMRRQENLVRALAALGVRVLNGEAADRIPVSPVDVTVNQLDWRQLRRWGLSDARIPEGTVVLFREPSVWERYRPYLIGGAALVLAQTVMIVALFIQRTSRRRAESDVQEKERQLRQSYHRIRDLGGRLIDTQEAERSHIARELHDDVSQQAALLAIDLHLLRDLCADERDDIRRLAHDTLERTQSIARTVHDLSHRLHPAKLRLLGLIPSLASLQRDVSDVVVRLRHHDVPATLPHDVTLSLFRVAQEALHNAAKHGAARHVSITVTAEQDALTMVIADDGRGFDVRSTSRGLGLISMRERLEAFGGTFRVQSTPGAGTRLQATVPLPRNHDAPPAV
jgi:signal transduction histidine kinase